MKLEPLSEGTLTADGTEQIVVESMILAILAGWLVMDKMEAGDTITIKQYVSVNGTYQLYAQEPYSNVQTEPVLHISPRVHRDRIKITLQQTTGPYKTFDYEFTREV